MLRRQFLMGVAATSVIPLVGCTSGGQTVTLEQVVAQVKDKCQYQTQWQSIAAIVVTIISGFNAVAGEASAIGVAVANQVVILICNAVDEKREAIQKEGPRLAPKQLVIVVNGVTIAGEDLKK